MAKGEEGLFKGLVRGIAEENLLAGKASQEELVKLKQLADSMSNKIKHLESVLDNDIINAARPRRDNQAEG